MPPGKSRRDSEILLKSCSFNGIMKIPSSLGPRSDFIWFDSHRGIIGGLSYNTYGDRDVQIRTIVTGLSSLRSISCSENFVYFIHSSIKDVYVSISCLPINSLSWGYDHAHTLLTNLTNPRGLFVNSSNDLIFIEQFENNNVVDTSVNSSDSLRLDFSRIPHYRVQFLPGDRCSTSVCGPNPHLVSYLITLALFPTRFQMNDSICWIKQIERAELLPDSTLLLLVRESTVNPDQRSPTMSEKLSSAMFGIPLHRIFQKIAMANSISQFHEFQPVLIENLAEYRLWPSLPRVRDFSFSLDGDLYFACPFPGQVGIGRYSTRNQSVMFHSICICILSGS